MIISALHVGVVPLSRARCNFIDHRAWASIRWRWWHWLRVLAHLFLN